MKALSSDAYKLLHDGALALSQVERNGLRIDMDYLHSAVRKLRSQIQQDTEAFKSGKVYAIWRRKFRGNTNIGSRQQLGSVLFDKDGLHLPCPGRTKSGLPKTDESSLDQVDHPEARRFLDIAKRQKALNTYLMPIGRLAVNGYLHPSFNLHTVDTFRSSSSNPNFQNIPIRIPEFAELIRQCFIPRGTDRRIVEIDYGGIEVKAAYWYHKDPVMKTYLHDSSKDMHRDMGMECYLLPQKLMTKNIRYCAKNKFVFPEFYGSYYIECSRNLWIAIDRLKLKTSTGVPLKKWLAHKGIRHPGRMVPGVPPEAGSFEDHIRDVERDFWGRRFRVYDQWKQDWYARYLLNGYFDMLSGFRYEGSLRRNQVINYPVQGVAFHCLLWSLIHLQKALEQRQMKSLIIGQIHDSIVLDAAKGELKELMKLAYEIMVVRLKETWDFIISPLEIEIEAAPPGQSWYHKEKVRTMTDL